MYALCSMSDYGKGINLKCDPELSIVLREQYPQVKPGYHMSKLHWNMVMPEAGLPDHLIKEWIDMSYQLVVAKLTKQQRLMLDIKA